MPHPTPHVSNLISCHIPHHELHLATWHFISSSKHFSFSPLGLCICCFFRGGRLFLQLSHGCLIVILQVSAWQFKCHFFREFFSVDFIESESSPTYLIPLYYSNQYVSFIGPTIACNYFSSDPPLYCILHGNGDYFCVLPCVTPRILYLTLCITLLGLPYKVLT